MDFNDRSRPGRYHGDTGRGEGDRDLGLPISRTFEEHRA